MSLKLVPSMAEMPRIQTSLQREALPWEDFALVGPITPSSMEWKDFESFRRLQMNSRTPYLLSSHQLGIERKFQIDERSLHFGVKYRGIYSAALRFTPAPFEFLALGDALALAGQRWVGTKYYEVGRLVAAEGRRLQAASTEFLLYQAGARLFQNRITDGLVGVCRLPLIPFFKRFGLQPALPAPVLLPQRNSQHYQIVSGTTEAIIESFKNHVKGKTDVEKICGPSAVDGTTEGAS